MPEIEDAREAEDMVRSLYTNPLGPHPYGFETRKQGYTWIVTYNIRQVSLDNRDTLCYTIGIK